MRDLLFHWISKAAKSKKVNNLFLTGPNLSDPLLFLKSFLELYMYVSCLGGLFLNYIFHISLTAIFFLHAIDMVGFSIHHRFISRTLNLN